jgi:hypothetical protein
MSARRSSSSARAALVLLAALPLVSGCVAAAAIPVIAAGGGLLKGRMDKRSDPQAYGHGEPRVTIDLGDPPSAVASAAAGADTGPRIVETRNYADGSTVTVSLPRGAIAAPPGTAAPLVASPAPAPAIVAASPAPLPAIQPKAAVSAAPEQRLVPVPSAPIKAKPAADAATGEPGSAQPLAAVAVPPPPPSGAPGVANPEAEYASLAAFAAHAAEQPLSGTQRMSALLARPGSLSPQTSECSIHPPAVVVDIDPKGGTLVPEQVARADPRFAATLEGLRREDVAIAWITALTADRAGAVRKALVASGLDPAGKDEVVLLRFPEERKQTRREDLAKEFCVVALVGDERADFDELFEYLRNPDGAQPLNSLIGNGWFLVPNPLD